MSKVFELKRINCDCEICRSWCHNTPGWFLPGEMEKAAALLGQTPEQFFKERITVDYWCGDTTFALRPKTIHEFGGEVSEYDRKQETCTFFSKGKCTIHEAKPYECAISTHNVELPDDFHEQTANSWRPEQEQITELLGYEPIEPEPRGGFFDLFRFSR